MSVSSLCEGHEFYKKIFISINSLIPSVFPPPQILQIYSSLFSVQAFVCAFSKILSWPFARHRRDFTLPGIRDNQIYGVCVWLLVPLWGFTASPAWWTGKIETACLWRPLVVVLSPSSYRGPSSWCSFPHHPNETQIKMQYSHMQAAHGSSVLLENIKPIIMQMCFILVWAFPYCLRSSRL